MNDRGLKYANSKAGDFRLNNSRHRLWITWAGCDRYKWPSTHCLILQPLSRKWSNPRTCLICPKTVPAVLFLDRNILFPSWVLTYVASCPLMRGIAVLALVVLRKSKSWPILFWRHVDIHPQGGWDYWRHHLRNNPASADIWHGNWPVLDFTISIIGSACPRSVGLFVNLGRYYHLLGNCLPRLGRCMPG